MQQSTFANSDVLKFYQTLPFNFHGSVEEQIKAIRKRNSVTSYPILPPLLNPNISVLEVGSGTGWLSNNMSFYYQCQVTGIDFNQKAIAFAQEVAKKMNLTTVFEVADLFLYQPKNLFNLVISLGVLHHTNNCIAALKKICTNFLAPQGYFLLGLYHKYGRKPFLEHFQKMRANGATEKQMLAEYKKLHSYLQDETHLVSWFRDQVLHPYETLHSLAEILPIFEELGIELVATSVNKFQPIDSVDNLLKTEITFQEIGEQKLQANQFYPGFFIVLGQKKLK